MKAAVYHGPNDLRIEHVPVPAIGPADVLVRVAVCGVSTGDVRRVHAGQGPFGVILGNEIAGTIERMGAEVTAGAGDRAGPRPAASREVPARLRRVVRVPAEFVDWPRRDPAHVS
jgi:L-iditol 2-dehydrogenase